MGGIRQPAPSTSAAQPHGCGSMGGVKRTVGFEQYYTDPALAHRCVEYVDRVMALSSFTTCVEPSAGDGAFLGLLPSDRRIGIDLEPRHAEVREADFLSWRPEPADGRILTIGNPPFGQRAALAVAFLRHACSFSDVVAFILPRSFNKYTFQDRVDPHFHLVGGFDCDEFVDVSGRPVAVRAVFQVWEHRDYARPRVDLPSTHPDFDLRHRHLSRLAPGELDELRRSFAFTVPQVGADFRPRDVEDVVRGSHWFVRPRADGVRSRFERLDFSFLDGMNTAHKSLSKRDIVAAYTAVVGTGTEPAPDRQS